MPIGKNAIKRVTNNGYSKVSSSAPDMENSEISLEKSEPAEIKGVKKTVEKKTAPVKKTPAAELKAEAKAEKKAEAPKKKASPKVKKSMESEPEMSAVKTLEKVTKKPKTEKKAYANIGDDLPYYLL